MYCLLRPNLYFPISLRFIKLIKCRITLVNSNFHELGPMDIIVGDKYCDFVLEKSQSISKGLLEKKHKTAWCCHFTDFGKLTDRFWSSKISSEYRIMYVLQLSINSSLILQRPLTNCISKRSLVLSSVDVLGLPRTPRNKALSIYKR